jgi:hypothetical protein
MGDAMNKNYVNYPGASAEASKVTLNGRHPAILLCLTSGFSHLG